MPYGGEYARCRRGTRSEPHRQPEHTDGNDATPLLVNIFRQHQIAKIRMQIAVEFAPTAVLA